MPTIREVKTELRHREWAEQIQECQSSGMTVTAWCKEKGISQLSSHLSMRQDTSRKLSGSISSVRCVSTICVIAVQVFCLPMEYP